MEQVECFGTLLQTHGMGHKLIRVDIPLDQLPAESLELSHG
jgi:hypothetical protein